MPEATLHPAPGKPCWIDLMTADQDGALAFYRTLFGWSGKPLGPEYGGYAVLSSAAGPAAGIGAYQPGADPAPPAWTVYFAVGDADAVTARIERHGGTVVTGPHEVPESGRMTIAVDPAGAVFGIWQPKPFTGFGARNGAGAGVGNGTGNGSSPVNQAAQNGQGGPSTPVWFELQTTNGGQAAAFYAAVLDLSAAPLAEMQDQYWLLHAAGEPAGAPAAGIWHDAKGGAPSWQVYFEVADTDTAVAAATGAGARVVRAAQNSPYGRLAVLADPQGALFTVIGTPGTE